MKSKPLPSINRPWGRMNKESHQYFIDRQLLGKSSDNQVLELAKQFEQRAKYCRASVARRKYVNRLVLPKYRSKS